MKIQFVDKLNEGALLEDKQVKFGGEVNPKYGWCVIYAGGPASGKSSSERYNIPIVGKKLDADEFKSVGFKNKKTGEIDPGFVKKFMGGKYYNMILKDPKIGGDESKMDINDSDYVQAAHKALDPFIDKVKDNMRGLGNYNDPSRLPNIIFDQTSKNVDKLKRQVLEVKQAGYKVAIVWVLTDIEKNLKAFRKRNKEGRRMPARMFMDIHPKVFNAMISVFDTPELLDALDEFWVVINSYKPQNTAKQQVKQLRSENVYHIDLVPDGLKKEKAVWKLIQKSLDDLEFYKELNADEEEE